MLYVPMLSSFISRTNKHVKDKKRERAKGEERPVREMGKDRRERRYLQYT